MRTFILLIIAVALFTACKKEDTGDPLSKYRLKEYTHNDYKDIFEYDSQNRIIKSGRYIDDQLVYNTRYFYVNNRLDSISTYNSNYLSTYETYKYTGDTILIISYRYAFDDRTALKYVKRDNQVVRILYTIYSGGQFIPYPDMYRIQNWKNGNLAAKYTYSSIGSTYPDYKSSQSSGEPVLTNSVLYEYDDHPNPFSALNEQLFIGAYESSKNNLVRMIVADMEGDTLFRIFKHTYNADGLPISTTETQEKNNTSFNDFIHLETSASTYTYEKYK